MGLNFINTLLNIILLIIVSQSATISHELGHAITALIFTEDNVKVTLGKNKTESKKISFKRLYIELKGFQPFLGFVQWNSSKITKFQKIMITAGGPIASLIIGVILIIISRVIKFQLLKQVITFSAYYHIWQVIITSIPIVYPKWWFGYEGHSSDGYKILRLIK